MLIVDSELAPLAAEALKLCKAAPKLVEYADPESGVAPSLGAADYEGFVASGDPRFRLDHAPAMSGMRLR